MNPAKYSISDLEKLTGVKAPTIRIWEKRYHIIQPERTDTNIRFYSAHDLRRLMNITFLNKHGFRISAISNMTDNEIEDVVARLTQQPGADDGFLSDLVQSAIDLDEDRFDKIINASILKLGFENAFITIVFPLLEKVNILWQINKLSACQERFASNLVRHKLVVAIDGLFGHSASEPLEYLLYLPSGRYDEISLLYASYLVRKQGHHVIYLGPSIPLDHLRSLNNREKINRVVTNLSNGFTDKELLQYTLQVQKVFPSQKLFLICSSPEVLSDYQGDIQILPTFKAIQEAFTG